MKWSIFFQIVLAALVIYYVVIIVADLLKGKSKSNQKGLKEYSLQDLAGSTQKTDMVIVNEKEYESSEGKKKELGMKTTPKQATGTISYGEIENEGMSLEELHAHHAETAKKKTSTINFNQ